MPKRRKRASPSSSDSGVRPARNLMSSSSENGATSDADAPPLVDGSDSDIDGFPSCKDEETPPPIDPEVELLEYLISLLGLRHLNSMQCCITCHKLGLCGLSHAKVYGLHPHARGAIVGK